MRPARLIGHAFSAARPLWFRPSAIALGYVLAQYVEQFIRTGGIHSRLG